MKLILMFLLRYRVDRINTYHMEPKLNNSQTDCLVGLGFPFGMTKRFETG